MVSIGLDMPSQQMLRLLDHRRKQEIMHQIETVNTGFFFLAPWLVFAPVVGLLINLILGRRLSENMIGLVASLASGAAFIVSVLLAYSVAAADGEMVRWQLAG